MGDNVFKILIDKKIEIFLSTFKDDATDLFVREGKLIHPGEFGMYRERSLIQLLGAVFTKEYQFHDGFIINENGDISTQCDIIISDANIDTITTDDVANFFPVEYVYGIGEVKSTLNRASLRDALIKLANTKQVALTRLESAQDKNKKLLDQVIPFSFLVCKKIDGFDKLSDEFWNEVYQGMPKEVRHNIILSLDDGVIEYELKCNDVVSNGDITTASWGHPFIRDTILRCRLIPKNEENIYYHIYSFLGVLRDSVEIIEKIDFPIMRYLNVNNEEFEERLKGTRK